MSAWLRDVIEASLPDIVGARRDELAAAILEALPGRLISAAIAHSAGTVLKQRAIADAGGDLARELGNNAAQGVLFILHDGEDLDADTEVVDVDQVAPEASSAR